MGLMTPPHKTNPMFKKPKGGQGPVWTVEPVKKKKKKTYVLGLI